MALKIENKPWWNYMPEDLQHSLKLSLHLADEAAVWSKKFHDYSFIVFPAAKAYEGFLKKLFLDLKFITEGDYKGKHFRIGKALNPNLERKYRNDDWVYKKLAKYCNNDNELPEKLWNTWREARNLTFHWFPDERNFVNHNEATEKLLMVIDAIDSVFTTCRVDLSDD